MFGLCLYLCDGHWDITKQVAGTLFYSVFKFVGHLCVFQLGDMSGVFLLVQLAACWDLWAGHVVFLVWVFALFRLVVCQESMWSECGSA